MKALFEPVLISFVGSNTEMGSELAGAVSLPGAIGSGPVRMGGAVAGRAGKRRSAG